MEDDVLQKILILGASGLVGKALIEEIKDVCDLYGTYFSSSVTNLPKDKHFKLDVHEVSKLKELIHFINPDAIVSCLRGDFDRQLEFHKELASELENSKSRVYYFSTANVFDGDYSRHHSETDEPFAESEYGKFKINCENALKEKLNHRAVIIRIPAIWGKNSPRMNSIKESIENNQIIDVYRDLECNNLLDTQLAKQLRFIIENQLTGTFHLGAVDMMAHGEFFEKIVNAISPGKSILKFNSLSETGNTLYWGLTSNRNDIPDFLQSTNQDIISCLLSQ
jgi:dTDP-4-dehydrorhamnose reductase